ncbi:unnamed protein product, partial [Polarella glacialis]
AETVLKIDPVTGEVTTFGGPFKGKQKWYGGLLGCDGCIYGFPMNATGVLKVNPVTQEAILLGDFPEGGYKWHGGVRGADGCLYGLPNHIDTVLKVDPRTSEVSTFGGPLLKGPDFGETGNYKWLGGVLAGDGAIYCIPGDAHRVLKIVPATKQAYAIGEPFEDIRNKWQNGFVGRDGCVYGIPQNFQGVLKIDPISEEVTTIGSFDGSDKWEGGVLAGDGNIYCMPLRAKKVLRISPATPDVRGGSLRTDLHAYFDDLTAQSCSRIRSAPSAAAEKAQPAEQQHEPATAASEASPPAVEAVSAPAEAVAAPVAVPAQAEAATAAPAAPPAPTRPPPTAPRAVASYADADDVAAAPQSSWTGEGGVAAAAAASEDPEVAAAVARLAKDAARRVRIAQAVNSRSVFITNLPFKATEDDIRSWLSPGGEIKEMRLSRDKATTRALGFGHVQFASPEAADEAVQKCDKVELQGRVMRLALVTAGDKFHFELPEEIKEDVRSLMREAYEGKNISCIKDAWQKRHPGQKLDMTKWGFKNFSSAMKTVESVTLEHHLTKTLTFCAFFGGSPTHLAFLEEKRKKDEEKKEGGDDAAQPAAGSGAGKRAAAEADRLPAEKKRQKVAQGSAPESAQSVDEKLAAAPSDFMTYYVTHIKTVPLDFLYARFGQAPQ